MFLPVHLYGQLVHDKTGCLLLEAQVPSYTRAACCGRIALFVFVHLCVICVYVRVLSQISATQSDLQCLINGRALNS